MKKNKTAVIMGMVGAIVGIMMSIVFSNSSNTLALIPVGGVLGGLIGTIIDRKNLKKRLDNEITLALLVSPIMSTIHESG